MRSFRISPVADRDIISILSWTDQEYGSSVRERYEKLIAQAIIDIAEDPDRAGCHPVPELGSEVRLYHLSNSRRRASKSSKGILKPRHLLLFRIHQSGTIEIGRVLHDSMDLKRHISSD